MFARRFDLTIQVLVWLFTLCASVESIPVSHRILRGIVTDSEQRPIWRATIIVRSAESVITTIPTDSAGKFMIPLADSVSPASMVVSAIGFESAVVAMSAHDTYARLAITLKQSVIELGRIRVQSQREREISRQEITSEQIRAASSASLIPGNPTAALTSPQLAKVGSNHSSQIRVAGTAPEFSLNGTSIGTDPNHFGAFSVVPGEMVQSLSFQPQGTDASHAICAAVEFRTPSPFDTPLSGALNLSTIEADASFRVGNSRCFALGSLRKSTLDKLVKQFDISSDRRTVPPTNFQDIFASAGVRLSPTYQLLVDQYYVRDYLSYNTISAGDDIPPTQIAQGTSEHFVGVKLQRVTTHAHLQASAAMKNSDRQYVARPEPGAEVGGSRVALNESLNSLLLRIGAELESGRSRSMFGVEHETESHRTIDLHQQNWNLLPPFAATDNPFIYQLALNQTFAEYSGNTPQDHTAAFASISHERGRVSIESGLRYERFSAIRDNARLLQRYHVTIKAGKFTQLRLHVGEYIENPVTTILEPNQALIRARMSELTPISTRLLTADFVFGPIQVGLFRKWVSGTPVFSPDFGAAYTESATINPEFLGITSSGRADFRGFSADLLLARFIAAPLSMHTSYGWSVATRTEHGITYPHELDSRHRFLAGFDCRASRKVTIGTEFQIRTGYPYSPLRRLMLYSEPNTYNELYLKTVLARENSIRFPINATINLHARFDFGRTEVTIALTNVTNRYNPMISSASGIIYDAGILPSFGLTWRF